MAVFRAVYGMTEAEVLELTDPAFWDYRATAHEILSMGGGGLLAAMGGGRQAPATAATNGKIEQPDFEATVKQMKAERGTESVPLADVLGKMTNG